MFRRFLRLLHKTTKQYHNLTFIKNEEHAIIVTSTLYSQFIQFVTNKLHKLLRHPILSFQKEQSLLQFLLHLLIQFRHKCLEVSSVCSNLPPHGTKL